MRMKGVKYGYYSFPQTPKSLDLRVSNSKYETLSLNPKNSHVGLEVMVRDPKSKLIATAGKEPKMWDTY